MKNLFWIDCVNIERLPQELGKSEGHGGYRSGNISIGQAGESEG